MGKKVTKKAIRDNMKCYIDLVSHAREMVAVCDGEKVDIECFALGAQAMAWYIQGLIDGEVHVETRANKLLVILTEVAYNEFKCRHDEDESDEEEDEDDETFASWLDRMISRLPKTSPDAGVEGGAEDDADAE